MDPNYNHEMLHGEQQPTNTKAKLSDLNKRDLIDLISHLEHEVHSRDAVISDLMNQQTKQVLYQAKYGRFGAADPFTALQRDSEKVTNDHFDHDQVKSLFDNQLQQLENLIETQRRAQATMREQKLFSDEKYKKVCKELDEARRQHAQDTAQGDDVTVALEKEREKLGHDLTYTKGQLKKCEKELKRTKSQLAQQTQVANKHKQVALDLIKERRRMVSKIAAAEKKNETIAQLLQKEREDGQKSENSRLLQLEARMERQLMDFDIEREQYKVRIRKEEGKVKDLLHQLTDIKETVLSLQQDSADSHLLGTTSGQDLTDSSNVPEGVTSASVSLSRSIVVSQNPSSVRQIEVSTPMTSSTSSQKIGEAVEQQTARIDPGPALSPPPKQSPDVTRSVTSLTGSEQRKVANSTRQSTSTVGTSYKPAATQSTTTSRISYYRQTCVVEQTTPNRIPSVSSPRSQYSAGDNKSTSQTGKVNRNVDSTSPSPSQSASTSIPTRVANRSLSNTAPQVSPKPTINVHVNKQPLRITTTSNVNSNRSSVISPRSHAVPPHLSSAAPSTVDSKLINVANWRSSTSAGSVDSSSSRSPRSTVGTHSPADKSVAVSKSKPPPPVRNVSLPSTKKIQSIENSS